MTTKAGFEFHEIADLFPLMEGKGYEELKADIAEHGVREPITLWEDKILDGRGAKQDLNDLERLGKTIKTMSRCGLGQTATNPVMTTMKNFPQLYEDRIQPEEFIPRFDLAKAAAVGCDAAGRTDKPEEE